MSGQCGQTGIEVSGQCGQTAVGVSGQCGQTVVGLSGQCGQNVRHRATLTVSLINKHDLVNVIIHNQRMADKTALDQRLSHSRVPTFPVLVYHYS